MTPFHDLYREPETTQAVDQNLDLMSKVQQWLLKKEKLREQSVSIEEFGRQQILITVEMLLILFVNT